MSAETLASRLAAAALTPGRIVFLDAQEREVVIPHAELFARARRAAGGIAALESLLRGRTRLHLRLGLAHPSHDGMAFAMVNNILPG